jgi:hypothetical protein
VFSFTSKLLNTRDKNALAKTLSKYINFQAQMEAFLGENKPESYWPTVALIFDVIDFNILEKLRFFARDLTAIFGEFLKALRGDGWNKALVQEISHKKIEFQRIVEAFYSYLRKSNESSADEYV